MIVGTGENKITPKYFENFDVTNLVTPVKVQVLENLQIESKYDSVKTEFLVKGFTEGFRLVR